MRVACMGIFPWIKPAFFFIRLKGLLPKKVEVLLLQQRLKKK
jgi:hypothetical protein